MLSSMDLERLIGEKRREIEKEKTVLGLTPHSNVEDGNKENKQGGSGNRVQFKELSVRGRDVSPIDKSPAAALDTPSEDSEIPPGLERYIRNVEDGNKENKQGGSGNRVQFKELSVRGRDVSPIDESPAAALDTPSEDSEIPPGLERYIRTRPMWSVTMKAVKRSKRRRCTGLPVMLKAGEYSPNNPLIRGERQSGDVLLGLGEYERRRNTLRKLRQQQYKEYLDQQAKIKQEAKEKAERERREREERDKAREEKERERERRKLEEERVLESPVRRASLNYGHTPIGCNNAYVKKVDACVQVGVGGGFRPFSVAVQTDLRIDAPPSPLGKHHVTERLERRLTPAERELSPREAPEGGAGARARTHRPSLGGDTPSILDAEAIERRNVRAQQEAVARREYYQRELKNQILEQQRIREERKARERLLEQAELRRLEKQLRALRPNHQQPEAAKGEGEASRALSSSVASFDVEGRLRRGLRGQGQGVGEGSQQMRRVEAKWLVPAVQSSVVREGRSSSVLTQLGAIRRQLQLEQLRLDSVP